MCKKGIVAGILTSTVILSLLSMNAVAADAKTYKGTAKEWGNSKYIYLQAMEDSYLLFDWDAVDTPIYGQTYYNKLGSTDSFSYAYKMHYPVQTDAVEIPVLLKPAVKSAMTQYFMKYANLDEDTAKSLLAVFDGKNVDYLKDKSYDEAKRAYFDTGDDASNITGVDAGLLFPKGESEESSREKTERLTTCCIVVAQALDIAEYAILDDTVLSKCDDFLRTNYETLVINADDMTFEAFETYVEKCRQMYSNRAEESGNPNLYWLFLVQDAEKRVESSSGSSSGYSSYFGEYLKKGDRIYVDFTADNEDDKFTFTCMTDGKVALVTELGTNAAMLRLQQGRSLALNAAAGTKFSTSDKSVATVSSAGKIVARRPGVAVITAKCGKETFKYRIAVTSDARTGAAGIVDAPDVLPYLVLNDMHSTFNDEENDRDIIQMYKYCAFGDSTRELQAKDIVELKAGTTLKNREYSAGAKLYRFTLAEKTKVTLKVKAPKYTDKDGVAYVGISNGDDFGEGILLNSYGKDYAELKKGTWTFTKTLPAGTYYVGLFGDMQGVTCKVTANKDFASGNTSAMPAITIKKGETLTVDGTGGLLKYHSSNAKVASIDKNGVVTGKKNGTAKITVQSDTGLFTYKVTIK